MKQGPQGGLMRKTMWLFQAAVLALLVNRPWLGG